MPEEHEGAIVGSNIQSTKKTPVTTAVLSNSPDSKPPTTTPTTVTPDNRADQILGEPSEPHEVTPSAITPDVSRIPFADVMELKALRLEPTAPGLEGMLAKFTYDQSQILLTELREEIIASKMHTVAEKQDILDTYESIAQKIKQKSGEGTTQDHIDSLKESDRATPAQKALGYDLEFWTMEHTRRSLDRQLANAQKLSDKNPGDERIASNIVSIQKRRELILKSQEEIQQKRQEMLESTGNPDDKNMDDQVLALAVALGEPLGEDEESNARARAIKQDPVHYLIDVFANAGINTEANTKFRERALASGFFGDKDKPETKAVVDAFGKRILTLDKFSLESLLHPDMKQVLLLIATLLEALNEAVQKVDKATASAH